MIGVRPEEKIALFADNSCRWLIADQGIHNHERKKMTEMLIVKNVSYYIINTSLYPCTYIRLVVLCKIINHIHAIFSLGMMASGAINVVRGSRSSVEELLQIYNHSERSDKYFPCERISIVKLHIHDS